jgi:hypothetical protein
MDNREAMAQNDGSAAAAASPTRALPLSALRIRRSAVKKEENDYSAEVAGDGQSDGNPASVKKPMRPNVDIDGLRRAINESLRKQNENGSRPAAAASMISDQAEKRAVFEAGRHRPGVASRSETSSEASSKTLPERGFLPDQGTADSRESARTVSPRIVRLSVPAHEDLDARRQVGRELSDAHGDRDSGSLDGGKGYDQNARPSDGRDYGSGHDEEHDTHSIKEARERINQSLSRQNGAIRPESGFANLGRDSRSQSSSSVRDDIKTGQPAKREVEDFGFVGPAARIALPSQRVNKAKGPDIITSG